MIDKSNFQSAMRAYGSQLDQLNNLQQNINLKAGKAEESSNFSFSNMLSKIMDSTRSLFKKSDLEQTKLLSGETNMVSLVTSISEAETNLQIITSVRDKLISAWQDIIRMQM